MRIVHLSDIHFSADNLDCFEQYYIDAISNDLTTLNKARKIDAVCLTGDLVDKGGLSFGSAQDGYEAFITKFWNPIAKRVGISNDILFMIPGNHDINEKKINSYYETGLAEKLKTTQDIDTYVTNYDHDNEYGLKRQEDYKKFEKEFYKYNQNSQVTDFESCHTLTLPLGTVGFACLNTSWRCSTKLSSNSLVFGTVQIRRAAKYLKDKGCKVIIGLMHHPLDFISDAERDEASTLLQNLGYNAVLFGHTHHGKTNLSIGNSGNLFVSTARTGFSNPAQEIDKYKSGYTILDFNFDELIVDCHYRKYIHTRIEFDKDVDLARDGTCSFPIKSFVKSNTNLDKSTIEPISNISATSINILANTTDDTLIPSEAATEEDAFLNKAIRAFAKESSRLNHNSSREDFEFVKNLEKELHKHLFFPLNDKIKNIPALQGVFVKSLFDRIHTSEIFEETILSDIQRIRDNKDDYKWYERKVIISAITLSLVTFKKFSQKKADLLIDFLTDFEENVWESALVGLVISLLYNHNKWDRFNSLKSRLTTLQALSRVQQGLHDIEQIFIYELYKNNFFNAKMYELDFFNNTLNCFLPFYENNPVLSEALDTRSTNFDSEKFERDIVNLPFVDSYKYVLSLAAQEDEIKYVAVAGEKYHAYIDKLEYSAIFYPYQNLIAEYYNYFNYYPNLKVKDIFANTLSINQNKLKNIILDKFNAIEIAADAQMHSENYSTAIHTLSKILEVDPNHYAANWKTALALMDMEKPNVFKALKHLEVLYSNNQPTISLILKIAACHRILNNSNEEFVFLKKAQVIDSDDRYLLIELGRFYTDKKKWDDALNVHKRVLRLYPNDYKVLMGVSSTHQEMKKLDSAIEYALKAEKFAPKEYHEYAYFRLYTLFQHNKNYAESINYALLIQEINPSKAQTSMDLGRAYLFGPARDIVKAKLHLEKSLKKSETYYCLGNLGHLGLISGNIDIALKYYERSIDAFATIEDFSYSMGIDEDLMIDSGVDGELYRSIKEQIISEKRSRNLKQLIAAK